MFDVLQSVKDNLAPHILPLLNVIIISLGIIPNFALAQCYCHQFRDTSGDELSFTGCSCAWWSRVVLDDPKRRRSFQVSVARELEKESSESVPFQNAAFIVE